MSKPSKKGKGTPWCAKCGKAKGKDRFGKTYCLPCGQYLNRKVARGSTSDYQPFRQKDDGPSVTRPTRIYRKGGR